MVGKTEYSSIPTSAELENSNKHNKYTVNKTPPGKLLISKPLCALMTIGAILLAILAALAVFFLVPKCTDAGSPEALVQKPKYEKIDKRLPPSIEPSHYRLRIIPDIGNLTTNGDITITIDIKDDTNEITLNVKDIEIHKHSLNIRSAEKNGSKVGILSSSYVEPEQYRITIDQTLKKGKQYYLDMSFMGSLKQHLQGFYKSEYKNIIDKKISAIASTQFSPIDARRAFPCFDEPSFKAIFSISIGRPKNMSSLSNMALKDQVEFADKPNWIWDNYLDTPKMSTYLVAFVVSDFQPAVTQNRFFQVWTARHYLSHAEYASTIGPQMLEYFNKYLNQFPLAKLDVVTIPDFGFTAMENWGLITFREKDLLYDAASSSFLQKAEIASVLGHELAHQWFGNLVTPRWWNDLWLKEGFATYLSYFGVNAVEPTWVYPDQIIFLMQEALNTDSLKSTKAISSEIVNNEQIRLAFNEISYNKGASLIRMMEHFLGKTTFQKGLHKFLEKFKYANADSNDLYDILTMEAQESKSLESSVSVKEVMKSWTVKPGFPVINAKLGNDNQTLIISQKRFFTLPQENPDKSLWWVPISVVTDRDPNYDNTKPKVWLKEEESTTINIGPSRWYLLNVNQTGFFIVNYEESNWRSIIAHIMEIPAFIQGQLIADSMELAKAGMLDYDIPLRLISEIAMRDDKIMLIPTKMAFSKLEFLSDLLEATPIFGLFEIFHKTIFSRTYDKVKFGDHVVDEYFTQNILQTVSKWRCRSPESKCAIEAQQMFRKWISRGEPVPPNIREIVYCTAIREGTEREWEVAYDQYIHTTSLSEKEVLLDALGCTTQTWLLSRYLHTLTTSSVRIQDASRVFDSIASNKFGTTIAFNFLRKNWDDLRNHLGDGFNMLGKMLISVTKHMNTEYDLAELKRFREQLGDKATSVDSSFNKAIELVEIKVNWMKNNYKSIEQWLTSNAHR